MEQELNQIQNEILKALEQHPDKALCTEAFIAKTIRDNTKIEGKNKAGLSLMDIEKVVEVLGSKGAFYSVHINSANDILVKKDSETKLTDADSKHRRLASEKSMSVLSNKDLSQTKKSKGKPKFKRTESKKLNVNDFAID
ncbi:MAG: hypothetical protein Q4B64_10635 [Spirochaetales bacterium]|nr:hypothetical protein [Spirochaetales bacterium]